jgi:hypothetical protein
VQVFRAQLIGILDPDNPLEDANKRALAGHWACIENEKPLRQVGAEQHQPRESVGAGLPSSGDTAG